MAPPIFPPCAVSQRSGSCLCPTKAVSLFVAIATTAICSRRLQAAIREASCIVFLGFAYHKQNTALLKPPKSQKTRQVYGTAFQMSDKDVDVVVEELESFFPDNENNQPVVVPGEIPTLDAHHNIRIDNKLTCAQLFDHHAKSLAG